MVLETEAEGRAPVCDLHDLQARLTKLNREGNTFAILGKSPDTYLQAAAADNGFIIERRDGGFDRHFYAAHPGAHPPLRAEPLLIPAGDRGQDRFGEDDLLDIFTAYFCGGAMPSHIDWVRMDMPDPDAPGTRIRRGLRIAFWVVVTVFVVGTVLALKAQRWF
jgi:hypothetical protein